MIAEQPAEHMRHPKHIDLHIFKRETGGWYAGFHKDGKYHRKATRTHDLRVALPLAEEWYIDSQAEIRLNIFEARAAHSLKEAAKIAIERLKASVERGERSRLYLNGIELLLNADILPFFGLLDVRKVGPAKWSEYEDLLRSTRPKLSRQTLHQHRNALRICLNEAVRREWIGRVPDLKIQAKGKREEHARVWLEPHEMRRLLKGAREHIRRLKNTRWAIDAANCYDFILWMANTGMRVGEAHNVRFCDVEVLSEIGSDRKSRFYCMIKNIQGKRGTGECRSWYSAYNAFKRLVERRGIADPVTSTENLFPVHYGNMFNTILEKTELKFTATEPRRKRDFVSLRHTYIVNRLLQGVPIYDIARNCRTSVPMIEQHYARFVSPRLMTGLNRFLPSAGTAASAQTEPN